jgi:ABC-type transport system involved in multi-copper enzyme maturation permease subunit
MPSLLSAIHALHAGHLRIFGPVLFYDLVRQARNRRFVALRFLYALFLVSLLGAIWASLTKFGSAVPDNRGGASIAQSYFDYFMVVQFVVVVLLTPAYVAGAIADEKERGTLDFMLATDLGNREIVLSKLVSRLANLSLIVLTSLPIVAILQFLGGIDPNLVLAVFAVTVLTMISLACISILFSVLCQRSGQAVRWVYLLLVVFCLGPPAHRGAFSYWDAGSFITFLKQVRSAGGAGTLATSLPELVRNYAYFHGAVALSCTLLAVALLRRVARAQAVTKAVRVRTDMLIWSRPPIRAQALLWKELHCGGGRLPAWVAALWMAAKLVSTLVLAYIVVIGYWLPFYYGSGVYRADQHLAMNGFFSVANFIVGSLTIVAVALRASACISGERSKQTLDTLLTTPLSCAAIMRAKWVGCMLSIRVGLIWLAIIWLVGGVTGGLQPMALVMTMATWTICTAFAAVLGMWFSMVSRSWPRAAVGTILVLICINLAPMVAWWCFGERLGSVPTTRYIARSMAKGYVGQLSPMFLLLWLPLSRRPLDQTAGGLQLLDLSNYDFCGLMLVQWLFVTVFLYHLTLERFRRIANRLPRRKEKVLDVMAMDRASLFINGRHQ